MEGIKAEKVTDTLTVLQKKGVFSYGTDAVMLADYVLENVKFINGKKTCDLCSGTGIIPLILCDKNPQLRAACVEISEKAADLCKKSVKLNGFEDRIDVLCADIKDVKTLFREEEFDFVTCNPPYMTANCGKMCDDVDINIARHEISCDIYDVFRAAFHLLKTGGCIYTVYRSDRLSALMNAAKQNKFEIKDIVFIKTKKTSDECGIFTCKAMKNASEGMKVSVKSINE
ncbi:MAG: methyltransferase [Clostridia bacterium]|nr:methyltransferase [Clostridia bacterium]